MLGNISVIEAFFTLNHHFWSKYNSIIHNDASSSEKSISTCLFRAVLACKRCLICLDFSPDSEHFFTGGSVIMDHIWVKNILMDLFQLCLLEWCGLLVDYCDVFISCLDSHSDGTHSLQSIHCWDTDAETHFYSQTLHNALISESEHEWNLRALVEGKFFNELRLKCGLVNRVSSVISFKTYTILPKVLAPLLMNRFDYFSNFYEYKS